VQSDGKIVVAGSSSDASGNPDFALVRYTGDPVAPSLTLVRNADQTLKRKPQRLKRLQMQRRCMECSS
jgi:hypothetical protein